ncbi:alpha/beta fold hydrolase [Amorphus orientalis]|uniref:Maspardin n=1 Tax=Amorphus orientalis TaxID=649198 RepID=A0AAE3VKH8_9HYPH|nr:alpha/beta hydrolase [Amorphus orientalis]MDQ0313608.1 pimeloyl-ACP methyl ester carboxylesterase [Amorphus orientalis]
MTNSLIADRDAFSREHPEARDDLNGRDWGVLEVGDRGPALLLVPGTLGRGDIFWQQMRALMDRVRIVAVSYPATGGVDEWADDLATLLDRRGIDRATVLGSSLGGLLVQFLAARHPDKVERLLPANTLVSTDAARSRPPYTSDLDTAPIEELRAGFAIGLGQWGATHPEQADLVELLLGEVSGRISEPELRSRLKGIKTAPPRPDLPFPKDRIATIEGDDDPLITAEIREEARALLQPGTAYHFSWGGHFPYVVRPDLYVSLLETELGLPLTGEAWGEGAVRVK